MCKLIDILKKLLIFTSAGEWPKSVNYLHFQCINSPINVPKALLLLSRMPGKNLFLAKRTPSPPPPAYFLGFLGLQKTWKNKTTTKSSTNLKKLQNNFKHLQRTSEASQPASQPDSHQPITPPFPFPPLHQLS